MRDKIYRDDVLNCPLTFTVQEESQAQAIKEVLRALRNYVKNLPSAEDEKPAKRTARKKTP